MILLQVFKVFLILILLPKGESEIIPKNFPNYTLEPKQEFSSRKECLSYLKESYNIKERELRLFADHDMKYGFFECSEIFKKGK